MNPENEGYQEVSREGTTKMMEGTVTIPFSDSFVYSNASGMGTSLMDVHITFAEVTPTGVAHQKVGIVMPIEHAAQLVLNLLEQVSAFEKNFGPIRHPRWKAFREGTLAAFDAMKSSTGDSRPAEEEKP
jgi:hypothetical protein